ncbi:hypothetical protein ACEWY4_008944 [Coilia grayii]|uniref:Type I cytokine receptor cytokine-binding domain-containing protein n=1 Tax=Coilia grayii TaxID=363190 RepID=A0ABD1K512_9TELE
MPHCKYLINAPRYRMPHFTLSVCLSCGGKPHHTPQPTQACCSALPTDTADDPSTEGAVPLKSVETPPPTHKGWEATAAYTEVLFQLFRRLVMKMFSVILAVITVCSQSCFSEVTSVDPPDNVTLSDLGLLGQLVIRWSPPATLHNLTDCSVRYQLEYFSTYKNEWRGYRTPRTSFRAQFDLERDVRVRLGTMLRGSCTNGVERTSPPRELLWPPHLTGVESSRVRNFTCVFHRKQYMECTWERGAEEPRHTQRFLYYWHSGMEAVAECPEYITSQGTHTGCLFPRHSVEEFTDFNVCVNGTSAQGPLRAVYVSLQVQNHVKPGPVEALSLEEAQEGGELLLGWSPPTGRVPPHCLEYEVTSEHTDQDGKEWGMVNITEKTSLVFPAEQRSCARVRSRVHEYCSDSSFWSDWSRRICVPDEAPEKPSPAMDIALICVLVASAVALLSLCISVWLFGKTWQKKREQKTQHYSLFWEDLHPKPAVSC